MRKRSVITTSPRRTIALGKEIGARLMPGAIVLLFGDLGTGKTVFVKGLGQGLEIKGVVKSPSFVIVTEYDGRWPVYHVDLFRLGCRDAAGLGLEEYFYGRGITVVEWADRLAEIPVETTLKVHLRYVDKNKRRVTIYDFRH